MKRSNRTPVVVGVIQRSENQEIFLPPLTSPFVQIAARLIDVTLVTTAESSTTPNPDAEIKFCQLLLLNITIIYH